MLSCSRSLTSSSCHPVTVSSRYRGRALKLGNDDMSVPCRVVLRRSVLSVSNTECSRREDKKTHRLLTAAINRDGPRSLQAKHHVVWASEAGVERATRCLFVAASVSACGAAWCAAASEASASAASFPHLCNVAVMLPCRYDFLLLPTRSGDVAWSPVSAQTQTRPINLHCPRYRARVQ